MITALINLLVWIVIIAIIFGLVDWLIRTLPIQDPAAKIIRVAMVVIFALIVILLLLDLLGVVVPLRVPAITAQ